MTNKESSLSNKIEIRVVKTVFTPGYKEPVISVFNIKQAIKLLKEDDIDFLNTILKSNKGRDDCLINMVKGRLKSKWIEKIMGDKLTK